MNLLRNKLTDTEHRLVVTEGWGMGEGWTGTWDQQIQSTIDRMDQKQDPTVQHRELYSAFYDKPQWERL